MPAAYRDARMATCCHCRRLMPLAAGRIGYHFATGTGRALADLCPGSQTPPADPGRC
jgi:hypothetical protein